MNIKAFLGCIIELIVMAVAATLVGIAFRNIFNGLLVFGVAFCVILFIYYFLLSLMEKNSLSRKVFYIFAVGYIAFFEEKFEGDAVVGVAIAGFIIGYVYVMFGIGLVLAMLISPITYNIQKFKKGNLKVAA